MCEWLITKVKRLHIRKRGLHLRKRGLYIQHIDLYIFKGTAWQITTTCGRVAYHKR